eukprot:g10793.t1 g10793   contig4:2575437-2576147(-)
MPKEFIRLLVPILHPILWSAINGACLVWSIGMLWLIFLYPYDPDSEDFVHENYYSYDLITCVVWVVEVMLDVAYYIGLLSLDATGDDNGEEKDGTEMTHQYTDFQDENILHIQPNNRKHDNHVVIALFCNDSDECRPQSLVVELILALYFMIDSLTVSVLQLRDINREDEHLTLDVMINAAAYLYITIRQYREWKERREKSGRSANPMVTKTSRLGRPTHIMLKSSSSSSGGIALV